MMRSGKAFSSHSGLIPSETLHEKRGGLLRPIARKRNLISVRLAAFFTIFVCIWSALTRMVHISDHYKSKGLNGGRPTGACPDTNEH